MTLTFLSVFDALGFSGSVHTLMPGQSTLPSLCCPEFKSCIHPARRTDMLQMDFAALIP